MKIELTYHGRPITKKNSSQIFRTKSGQPFITPSAQYKQYEKDCIWQTPAQARISVDTKCNCRYLFYMPTHGRVDGTNLQGSIDDILVKAGVLLDDNNKIIAAHDGTRVRYDKTNPRVEITITDMEEE